MTIDEFIDTYTGSPFSLEEVAEIIVKENIPKLNAAAGAYLARMRNFERKLEEAGFEFG